MSAYQHGRLVNLEETDDGNLRIILNTAGEKWFDMIRETRDRLGIDATLRVILDDFFKRNWQEVRPEEIGALTSAIIITTEAVRDQAGKLVRLGRVYWNPQYQVEDEIETLDTRGEVLFRGSE